MARGAALRHARRARPLCALCLVAFLFLSVALLLLLAFFLGIFSLPVDSDRLSAWTPADREGLGRRKDTWTEVLSWEPRAFLYHNFLSKQECEHLIELAKPHMQNSTAGNEIGYSRIRTSTGMFLNRGQDKIITDIERRIADFSFIPIENGEGLQVLHYEVGQKYEPHFDFFVDKFNTIDGGQRMATMLMYLSDVEEGGETVFPDAKYNSSSLPYYNELSECGKSGIAVKPKMGDALLFWSMKPDATLDLLSLHGGCPVIKGDKWSATKWMHESECKNLF